MKRISAGYWPRHSRPGPQWRRWRVSVATSLIYKWRRTMRARETGFAEVVVAPDEPVAVSRPAASPAVIELEVAGKVRLRIPLTTPPTLAAAMVKALGVS